MPIRTADKRNGSTPPGNTDSPAPWLAASVAYENAISSLHALGRTLEGVGEQQHALAAAADSKHLRERYTKLAELVREYALEARQDADRLNQRAQRHLKVIAKGAASNDVRG